MFPCETAPGAPESGGDFVEYEIDSIFIAQFPCFAQILRMIEPHASGSLHDRFEYKCGYLPVLFLQQIAKRLYVGWIPFAVKAAAWLWHEEAHRQRRAECTMHPGHRVAHAHRIPCVAVIARPDCGEICLGV